VTRCLHEPCQTVSSIIIRSDSLNLRPPFSMVANIDASARDDPLDCAEASARTNSIQHCTPTLPLRDSCLPQHDDDDHRTGSTCPLGQIAKVQVRSKVLVRRLRPVVRQSTNQHGQGRPTSLC
jgi:hypothetical protein